MSPEQVRGAPIDGRSDIFCLGTILYEITLGRRLWRGPREVAVKRIVEERPKPPTFVRRDYPAELELIVLRSLEKKPEDRYQSATELHDDLQNFLARSNAHLRNNFQMADYVAKIFSEEADALVSDAGRLRAQAFVEGSDAAEPDQSDLDFDTQRSERQRLLRGRESGRARNKQWRSRSCTQAMEWSRRWYHPGSRGNRGPGMVAEQRLKVRKLMRFSFSANFGHDGRGGCLMRSGCDTLIGRGAFGI
jgi:serine/threonine protein kinase